MPQCKAQHVVSGVVWYCVQEVTHNGTWPHEDDKGRSWNDRPRPVLSVGKDET